MNTNVILGAIVVILLGVIGFLLFDSNEVTVVKDNEINTQDDTPIPAEPDGGIGDGAEPIDEQDTEMKPTEVIGSSVGGHDIVAHHFGNGENELLFVGGIHAGYSGNTVVVAQDLIDYLDNNPTAVPEDVRVTVIPVLNPDGLKTVYDEVDRINASGVLADAAVTTPGRFNANNVDLNRNFDCQWKTEGTWQNKTVSGGTAVFSEPEARAVRDYVETHNIAAAVVYYSAAGGVYSSSCGSAVSAETKALTSLYATAAGYDAYEEFDSYEINGDMVNWLAKNDIPAISVLLSNHTSAEWTKNQKGIEAILNYYSE